MKLLFQSHLQSILAQCSSPLSRPGASSPLPTMRVTWKVNSSELKCLFPVRALIQPVQSYSRCVHRTAEHSTPQHPENRRLLSETFPNGKKRYQIQMPLYGAAGGCLKSTPMTPQKAMQTCNRLQGEHKVHTCNEKKTALKGPRALPGQSLSAGIEVRQRGRAAVPVSLLPALL